MVVSKIFFHFHHFRLYLGEMIQFDDCAYIFHVMGWWKTTKQWSEFFCNQFPGTQVILFPPGALLLGSRKGGISKASGTLVVYQMVYFGAKDDMKHQVQCWRVVESIKDILMNMRIVCSNINLLVFGLFLSPTWHLHNIWQVHLIGTRYSLL